MEKFNNEIEDSFDQLIGEIKTVRRAAPGNAEELLRLYKKENEFLQKKLEFYAHLNSHQLRAPLVQMMGLLDLLKKSGMSKREKLLFQYLELATENMDEMIRCINRVLQAENSSEEGA